MAVDLPLTDFVKPGMRGSEVVSEALRMHPEAHVIVMSGYADRGMQTEEKQMKYTFLQNL
jgi:YesN/AraC family two-component response regulator